MSGGGKVIGSRKQESRQQESTMLAAVCREFGRPLEFEELSLDPIGRSDVRVEVAACAICHSDIHYAQGAWGGDLPAVYGHEAAGTVVEVGGDVSDVEPGERVAVSLIRSCQRCSQCLRGLEVFCAADLGPPAQRLRDAGGQRVQAALRCGAFAQQATVHHSQVVRLPDEVDWPSAALLGCGVITGIGAVVNTSSVDASSTVAVIGVGGVGLNAVQGAAIAGVGRIVAVDVSDYKLAQARRFGATHTFDSSSARSGNSGSLTDALAATTGQSRVTHAFVTVGSVAAIRAGMEIVTAGGELVIVGMPPAGSQLAIDPSEVADKGLRIIGSKMGSARLRHDIERILKWQREGALDLDSLVSNVYSLAQINSAIDEVVRGDVIRNVVAMADI